MIRHKKPLAMLVLILCLALLATLSVPREVVAADVLRDLENSFVEIAEKVKPGIVHLTSETRPFKRLKGKVDEEDLHRFFGPGNIEKFKALATGSGVIMDKQGHILTNNHLVEASEKITVKITGSDGDRGKEYEGRVIGRDKATDLAVIKIDPK